jgi:hypothetical protein
MTGPIYLRLPAPLKAELARRGDLERGGAADIVRRDLARYYQLLREEERRLPVSEQEWNLLRDALNGVLIDAIAWRFLDHEIADAIRLDQLDAKWGVDGAALVETLRALCPGQTLAVVDAVERWWRGQAQVRRG